MSTREQHTPTIPTSAVRNTEGRSGPQGLEEPTSDEVLRELCDKNYHQLLPLIAKKMQKEKEQQDKLNAVKARLLYGNETGKNQRNHEESHYSESKTPTARTEPKRRHGNRRSRSPSPVASVFKRLKQNRPPSPRPKPRKEGGVFNRKHHHRGTSSWETGGHSESEDSEGGHWKSKSRRHRSNTYEDDLSQPWTYEEKNPFTPRIRHFNFPRTRMPGHVKTYDGSGDLEDHLKLFQVAAKTERWAMPTWCHMFNSTLTRNARGKLSPINKTHQGYGGDTSYQAKRWRIHGGLYGKIQSKNPGCGRSVGMHEDLRIHARVTTSFLKGEVVAFSHSRKKAPAPFSLLTKTPKEIFALEKGKFKAPPPMVTPAEKRDPNKYCEFHADTRHSTDECMQLRKQIDEIINSGKLSQFIKELKQNDKPKAPKKGETAGKDKPLAILMIQPWERVSKQRVTQSFSPEAIIYFPSLGEEDRTEGPMIIEAEIGGHFVHRIYVVGGASLEFLYEHCFIRLQPKIRSQMIPATTSLIGFSGETIWPIGQISLLVKIGDEEHSTSAWMNIASSGSSQK
ncbi:hypothetical protein Tco_0989713 [Tanacetum coccineum]|uniref:Reverse transcriptase domain-containing protein n=1 Tax=Tanacetum coccineum TaxID=301880 RepID=A0ABQ5EUX5_9ASTR